MSDNSAPTTDNETDNKIFDHAPTSQSSSDLLSMASSRSQEEKLKQIIRQLYQDKQELKKALEKECKDHNDIVSKLKGEMEKGKIPEDFDQKMQSMQKQISELTSSLRTSKLELNDYQLNNQVLQKQVDQYKITISSLEYDLSKADSDRYQLAVTKAQVYSLEDEIRQKNRQIKELETSAKWNEHEIQKLKGQIAHADVSSHFFSMVSSEISDIEPQNVHIPDFVTRVYSSMNESAKSPTNEDIKDFICKIPEKIRLLQEENERIMQMSLHYKHRYAKIKGSKPNEDEPSPEKLKEAMKKLLVSNHEKTEKIKVLKAIAERQHTALQKLIGNPSNGEALTVGLRKTIRQLATCNPSERSAIAAIAERMMDSMLGVQV